MKVISVNVGLPREIRWNGALVRTAIFKKATLDPVKIRRENLAGDEQADLSVHGGPQKAVYAYPSEHYEFWRNELPDLILEWGTFGENLTTDGLSESTLYIGDRLKIGTAVLMVSQPRMPCFKLALRFQRDDIVRKFLASRRSGFYFSVIEEGEVHAGSAIEILSREPNRVSVTDMLGVYLGETPPPDLVRRAMKVDALSTKWKNRLAQQHPHEFGLVSSDQRS